MTEPRFWETKTLQEMTGEEWESLCDGCSQCCRYKFEDIDTGELFFTQVVCKFLDLSKVRCTVYHERTQKMPTCIQLTPDNAGALHWMPPTCAYRLLAEGKPLPEWHPLVSGNPGSVEAYGISVRHTAISENDIHIEQLEDYLIEPSDPD